MRAAFPVLIVPTSANVLAEPMGSKSKFWSQNDAGQRWLFKFARAGTGEHWSEKIAAEVALLLGVPAATVELARCEGAPGCSVLSFISRDEDVLVHGNELLQQADASYPAENERGVSLHTIAAVMERLRGVGPPPGLPATGSPVPGSTTDAQGAFVGYLLLDALLLNTDRHHENWGIVQSYGAEGTRVLAPSYDHASSLGRELRDPAREARLAGRDPRQTVRTYVARARSAFFAEASDSKPLSPLDAFLVAANLFPGAAAYWVARLREIGHDEIEDVIQAVPTDLMSDASRRFALEMMRLAREDVLGRFK